MSFDSTMTGLLRAHQYVQAQGEDGRQRGERNQQRSLAQQYYSGGVDPAQLPQFLGQAAQAGADPESYRKDAFARAGQHAAMLLDAPEGMKPQAYANLAREVRGLGFPVPEQYDANALPMIAKFAQQFGSPGTDSASLREFRAMTAGMKPEDVEKARRVSLGLDPRPSSGLPFGFMEVQGEDGKTRVIRTDKRDGSGGTLGTTPPPVAPQPAAPPPGTNEEVLRVANAMAQAGVPDAQIEAWVAKQPGITPAAAPPMVAAGPDPFTSRSAEQQAALTTGATEQAKIDAQVANAERVGNAEAGIAAAKATAETDAKIRTERSTTAELDLPKLNAVSQAGIDAIDRLLTHRGLKSGTGLNSLLDPRNRIPGTDAYDFGALVDQVKGKAFLEAFNTLRGGGQITEVEGKKATDAIAALDRGQSPEQFMQNLRLLKGIMAQGMIRARNAARRGGAAAPAAAGDFSHLWGP